MQPLTLSHFPRAILHIDGDAFFASCEQSRNPELKGRPVITGQERGIAASMSYEAKARGVTRAMTIPMIKKICPDAIILPSDYETYSLLSKRLYCIVRRYTPEVEEYGIDECFADITGLQRPLRMPYERIAEKIKADLDSELGFTFSVGLGPNKVIAKIASKYKKPSGLTIIKGCDIHRFINKIPVDKVWGIGFQTTALLRKYMVRTALDFAVKSEDWVKHVFYKPHYQIWQELNGQYVLKLDTKAKTSYQSIQKVKTFTPATKDRKFVFSQLSKNIENACIKARRYKLEAKGIIIFLRTADFRDIGFKIKFSRATSFPNEIIKHIETAFEKIFNMATQYRSTGAILFSLQEQQSLQLDLFGQSFLIEKMTKLYNCVDKIKKKYGKHTLYLGSSFFAHETDLSQDRNKKAQRARNLFKGETTRKRLGLPMFVGPVK